MQERLIYRNHLNETIEFGRAGVYVKASDLHDYTWTVAQKNNRIAAFTRAVQTRTLPIIISAKSAEEGVAVRNRLLEIAEKDVLAKVPGRIIVGDYYLRCYVTASKKSKYLFSRRYLETSLTITTDEPYWVRESLNIFRKGKGTGEYLDYPIDYAYDFMPSSYKTVFFNADFIPSNFRMFIYGPCINPAVRINGHAYAVSCTAAAGEYITIDTVAKTVTKTGTDGTVTNLFNQRSRDAYIFEKIQPGDNAVSWDGEYGVDLVLMEERSEPKWT